MHVCLLSCFSLVQLFMTLWTAARQAPPSIGFSRQAYWSGVPLPSPQVVSRTMFYLMSVWETLSLPPSNCDTCHQFLVLLACFCSTAISASIHTAFWLPVSVSTGTFLLLYGHQSYWIRVHSNKPILSWLYLKYPMSKSQVTLTGISG